MTWVVLFYPDDGAAAYPVADEDGRPVGYATAEAAQRDSNKFNAADNPAWNGTFIPEEFAR